VFDRGCYSIESYIQSVLIIMKNKVSRTIVSFMQGAGGKLDRNYRKALTLIKTFPILILESLTCVSLLQGTALEAGTLFEHFLDSFRTLFGHLLDTFRTLVGHFLDFVGHVWE
jgi:hypothetical protein